MQILPFAQHEFSIGLAIFSVVPTTLGAGVAFTQASRGWSHRIVFSILILTLRPFNSHFLQVAHGNSALALFLTVATNLLAVVTVPFLLRPLLAGDSMIHIHPGVRPSLARPSRHDPSRSLTSLTHHPPTIPHQRSSSGS